MWRRPVGPGWSSFAVRGDLLYTQEQRGTDEVVACYNTTTGQPVWTHNDSARFFESNGGAGPRATPTLSRDRVYTFGATGILNALDAGDGTVVWSRNVTSDNGSEVPYWGFSSSPVVVDDVVVVAAAGQLLAYGLATGAPRWSGQAGEGYSSPHLATIDGVVQILLMSTAGTTSVAPADGKQLWQHPWRGSPIVQPAVTADGDILIVASTGSGTRRLAVAHGPRVDRRGALDVERTEAVLQRLRRSQGSCVRLRRPHPGEHRPRERHAQVEGWTLRQRPADPVARPGLDDRVVGGG